MRCFISKSHNPYFNLATEEYFLKNSSEEIFMLYINEPCIVAGKHQNLLSEINLQFAINKEIKLARRISGGGTVYQDFHNLNFSFITNVTNTDNLNFATLTYPILNALKDMGLNVVFSGRNDILIDSKKISGNAMHIFKRRVLSHGTLLYDTDLERLSMVLQNNGQKYDDKSIKSVRSQVTNITNYLTTTATIDIFSQNLFQTIIDRYEKPVIESLNDNEEKIIKEISIEKYETWEWIYGYSPKYQFKNNFKQSDIQLNIEFHVEKGIIRRVIINSDQLNNHEFFVGLGLLNNARHDYQTIHEILTGLQNNITNSNFNISELCYHLF
jgi:lipoate---protein ligase